MFLPEQNQQLLMECPGTRQHMVQLLASPVREIQRESLELLSMYTQTQHGRDVLIDNLNLTQYVFFVPYWIIRYIHLNALHCSLQNYVQWINYLLEMTNYVKLFI